MAALHPHRRPSSRLPGDAGGERHPSQRGRLQREQLPAPAFHGPVQPERRRLLGVRVHPRLLSCGASPVTQLHLVHLRRRSCPPQGRFRGLLDKCGRGRRSVGPLACGMLAVICRREPCFLCAGGTGGGSITSTSKVGPSRQAGRMAHWGCSRPNEEPWLRGGRLWRKAAFAGFGCRGSCSRAPPAENRPIGNSPQWDDSA